MYLNGIGTDSNFTEARKWATTGYQLGNSYAAAVLGYTYFSNMGWIILKLSGSLYHTSNLHIMLRIVSSRMLIFTQI